MHKLLHGTNPEKPLLTYEYVILKNMNFNLRPPFRMIQRHMSSILLMIDKDLKQYLDETTYNNYATQMKIDYKERKFKRRRKKNTSKRQIEKSDWTNIRCR